MPISLDLLRAVHLMTVRDEESAVADASSGYQGPEHSEEDILSAVAPDALGVDQDEQGDTVDVADDSDLPEVAFDDVFDGAAGEDTLDDVAGDVLRDMPSGAGDKTSGGTASRPGTSDNTSDNAAEAA